MSNVNIMNLQVAISLDGTEYLPVVQGGTTKRVTALNIANTATGFVPTSRVINAGVGLSGGGALTTDITLDFAPGTQLSIATTQAADDRYVIYQDSSGLPRTLTFTNSMKAINTLAASPALDLTADKFVVYRASDGLTYAATASQISLAAGNVPAGGTTGQVLAKNSSTNYDTSWINNSITLNALSLAGNPTAGTTTSTSVTLGSTLTFVSTSLRTVAGTGDVTWAANSFATTIAANAVTNSKFRQSAALTVVGNATNATADVADIAGTANQVLRVNGAGTALAFGSIDLAQSATVGTSILPVSNGGTGVASTTAYALLAGGTTSTGALQSLSGVGTSGQILVSNGAAALPTWQTSTSALGQALTKVDDTNVTLSLGGAPTTALLSATSLTLGWTGQLGLTRGGTAASLTASNGGIVYSTASAMAILAGTATAGQHLQSGSSAAPSWTTATFPSTAAAGTILAAGTANTITATATPTLGASGTTLGTLGFAGNTSGTVTVRPQAAAGTPTLTFPNASGTFAVSATAPITLDATTGAIAVTGSALTKVDDTNVTLTLGGTPTTALLAATSLTLGWTGQLGLTRGGTAASLTASNGGIVYSTASAMAILSGTATAGQILRSGSSAAPSWSTATYPATTTINQLLYSSAANVIGGLATTNGGILNADSSGVPSMTVSPTLGVQQTTRGSLILANTAAGAFPATIQSSNVATVATTLTLPPDAGSSGSVLSTNGSGTLTWASVAGTGDVTAAANFGTDNILIRSDGTGKGVQGSGITIDDSNNVSGLASLALPTIPFSGIAAPINLSLAVSASASALTIAIKGANGSDASATNPVYIPYRSATGTTGTITWRTLNAASSIVVSSGSTLGITSSTAFRIWVVMFDDAGTLRPGVIVCGTSSSSQARICALANLSLASSTAEGGAGAADSAQTFYTGTAVTSKPYSILGYAEWSATGVTAGTWTTTNLSLIQTYGPGVKLPGDIVQIVSAYSASGSSATTTTFTDVTGSTMAITLTSPANFTKIQYTGSAKAAAGGAGVNTEVFNTIARGGTQIGPQSQAGVVSGAGTNFVSDGNASLTFIDFPNSAASISYTCQQKGLNTSGACTTSGIYGCVAEIMV